MRNLRRKFQRFLYNHSGAGIPNLMLYVCVATAISYFVALADKSGMYLNFIRFDRDLILHGQVWRLLTFILYPTSNGIWLFLLLFAYYGIGRMVEQSWGTLKFNLFYLSGILIMDVAALILGFTPLRAYAVPSATYLNLSLFLALATMYPDNRVLLMYIIPLKMKYLAWVYLLMMLFEVIVERNLFPVFALLNYFLFFGWDWVNVLPESWQDKLRRPGTNRNRPNPDWAKKAYPGFRRSSGKQAGRPKVVDAPAYRHKCAVCGRTDVSDPDLEFRYCSRCNGYYCYCADHINNHAHIT